MDQFEADQGCFEHTLLLVSAITTTGSKESYSAEVLALGQRKTTPTQAIEPSASPGRMSLPELLLKLVTAETGGPLIHAILSDSAIVRRLITEWSERNFGCRPNVCESIAQLAGAVDDLATPPLFGTAAPLLVVLPDKLNQGNAQEVLRQCKRLLESSLAQGANEPRQAPLRIIGNTSLRKSFVAPEGISFTLSYGPSRNEIQKIMRVLYDRRPELAGREAATREHDMAKAAMLYDSDFVLADDHFRRMAETGFAFSEVFADLPLLSVFELVDALPVESPASVLLRLEQALQGGEDPSRILNAVNLYFRQLLKFIGLLEGGMPESQALTKLGIPYPAQAKFSAGARRFGIGKIFAFLERSSDTELSLRQTYRSSDALRVEFACLLS